jgi:hypothetical protein
MMSKSNKLTIIYPEGWTGNTSPNYNQGDGKSAIEETRDVVVHGHFGTFTAEGPYNFTGRTFITKSLIPPVPGELALDIEGKKFAYYGSWVELSFSEVEFGTPEAIDEVSFKFMMLADLLHDELNNYQHIHRIPDFDRQAMLQIAERNPAVVLVEATLEFFYCGPGGAIRKIDYGGKNKVKDVIDSTENIEVKRSLIDNLFRF